MEKQWTIYRTIKGYERYEISIHGQVRNRITKRVLKPFLIGAGYEAVTLSDKNKVKKIMYVHQLVAKAFINNPGLPEINHIDEVKTNNHISNLEYCTRAYNCRYGTRGQRISRSRKRTEALARQ